MPSRRAYYYDLLERTAWTGVEAALGFFIDHAVSGEVTWRGVAYAAAIAVAKALVARKLPWTADDSASSLPESVDPPQEG